MVQPVCKKEWTRVAVPQTGEEAFYGIPYKEPFIPLENGCGFEGVLLQNFAGEDGDKVQCHICGEWFGQLTVSHLKTHGYNLIADYKDDYGFLQQTALMSEKLRLSRILNAQKLLASGKWGSINGVPRGIPFASNRQPQKREAKPYKQAQFLNEHGTCTMQLLQQLKALANEAKNDNISSYLLRQNGYRAFIGNLEARFGNFNQAKQLAGLLPNEPEQNKKVPREVMVADIIRFTKQYKRNPTISDLKRGLLVFSPTNAINEFGSWSQAQIASGLMPNLRGGEHEKLKLPISEIISMYNMGKNVNFIAQYFRCAHHTISNRLKGAGIHVHHRGRGRRIKDERNFIYSSLR